ncbi:MAG TPA: DedA family protein [Gemmataceae bacterium]|nr:DedA family protein [Gemmataceae bacterium]
MSEAALAWYASIFLWLYFTGIGIPPCPEEAGILYAAGVSALHPEVHWWGAWPAAGCGIVCADMTLYWIGRWWGPHLFEHRWVKRLINTERRQQIEGKFKEHGIKLLLMARLLPPLRTGVFVTAGAIRYPFLRFVAADAGYAVVGVGIFFFGGAGVINALKHAGHWAAYVLAGVIAAYGLYRYYRYLKAREVRQGERPPASVLELPAGDATKKAVEDTAGKPR